MTKKRKKKWKRVVNNKLKSFGETNYKEKKITINKKKSKKAGNGEVLDTIVHEEMHRKHPRMREKTVKKLTALKVKRMAQRTKNRLYSKYS